MGSGYLERARAALSATTPTRETQVAIGIAASSVGLVAMMSRGPSPNGQLLIAVLFLGVSAGLIFRALPRRRLSPEQALFLVDLGDLQSAADVALRTLRARVPGLGQARAWLVLARCAELEGDFADALELLESGLPLVDEASALGQEFRDRRAFALAALGRTPEVAALLQLDTERLGPFRTAATSRVWRPLSVRAALLCLRRQGDLASARELLAAEGTRALHELTPRDRAIVRHIARWAGASTDGSFSDAERDPAVVAWTDRVLRAC